MKRLLLLIVIASLFFSLPVFCLGVSFGSNVLLRYERQQFPDSRPDVTRYRLRVRPSLIFTLHPSFEIGVEAEGNAIHESDGDTPLPGFSFPQFHNPTFDRDNFKRNEIVLSRAFFRYSPSPHVEALAGKFDNPFLVTDLVWDRDLRPNGGAFSASYSSAQQTFTLTGRIGDFYASHYLHDRTNVVALQAVAQGSVALLKWTLSASYYDHKVDELSPGLLRGNTRVGLTPVNDYNLVDFIARGRFNLALPITAQIDFVDNRSANQFTTGLAGNGKQGFLLELFIGQLQAAHDFRLALSRHRVESDAVLAAYNTDDWWFPTRGEGYRIQGAFMPGSQVTISVSYLRQKLIDTTPVFKRWQISAEFNWQ